MKELIDILKRNSNIKKLLGEFKKDFADVYYGLKENEKSNMLDHRDIIYRKWLFSPLVDGTYITPNFIINNIAQQKCAGNYSIMPYIKIAVNDNGELTFKVKFKYFSSDSNPVIDDLEKIIRHLNPTIIIRDENLFVVDGGEKLVEKLSIRSDYYIDYLIELSTRLKILESMRSIGCKCYKIGGEYDNYIKLTNREKLELIVEKSIEISSERISDILESDSKDSVLQFLDNGITEDSYFESMQSSLKTALEFVRNISEYTENDEEIRNITVARSILGDDISYWLVKREAGVYLDIYLTCIFGYYLGIINPIYEEMFLPGLFMELLNYSNDPMERITYIFNMELAHDLTKFGEEIMKSYKNQFKDSNFKLLIPSNIKKCISEYKNEKEVILEDIKRENGSFIKNILNSNRSGLTSKSKY